MKIIEFIRLVRKHIVLLVIVPVSLAVLTTVMTREPAYVYTSRTSLYTGLATGTNVELDKAFNYFATNTSFDNLINIINSRETQEAVAIRLLCQHLMLDKADPKYISEKSFQEFKKLTPAYIYSYIVRHSDALLTKEDSVLIHAVMKEPTSKSVADTMLGETTVNPNPLILFPSSINRLDYERTVANLTRLMKQSDTNFVYRLLNFNHPHYSIGALSTVKAERINNSDLIRMTYQVDDPGICQQTLAIFNEVCISNYKNIRENRSDAVVKYFEAQLVLATRKLKDAEDNLLVFNKQNNIINYNEQSRAVTQVKEDLDVDYNNKKAQLAGTEATIKKLEEKLNIQQQVQLKSASILDKRRILGDLTYQIADAEADVSTAYKLPGLRRQSDFLKTEIQKSVDDLYGYQHTTDGLPVANVLNEWLNNITEAENLKAKMRVMEQRSNDFQQQFSAFAPAGANIKRIEREIAVSEQGYLEILHGLNQAKLKLQDNELSANIKCVDSPYFPLSPNPTKRKVMIIAAAFFGMLLVLAVILMMEFFDKTLKNLRNASQVLQIPSLGVLPKILLNPGSVQLEFIQNRLLDLAIQNLEKDPGIIVAASRTKTILFFSTTENEGKTVVAGNMARKLISQGKSVILLNYSEVVAPVGKNRKFPLLNRLLGYSDPRVNRKSDFLLHPSAYLAPEVCTSYKKDGKFSTVSNYTEALEHAGLDKSLQPDYIFIELPAILFNNYPAGLVAHADLSILICRANRIWSEADKAALEGYITASANKTQFIINGVALQELESVLGDLPRKRNLLRKKLKNLFRFQFFSNNEI